MSVRTAVLVSVALFGLGAFCASAKEGGGDKSVSMADAFGTFGYSEVPEVTDKACRLTMTIDQKTFLKSVPYLQKIGLLNDEISQTKIKMSPMTITMAFAMQLAPTATHQHYEANQSADKCQFVQKIKYADEFGNSKSMPAFSYSFTKALDKKINWEEFESQNLMKVAPNFTFSPEFMALVRAEQ